MPKVTTCTTEYKPINIGGRMVVPMVGNGKDFPFKPRTKENIAAALKVIKNYRILVENEEADKRE